MPMRKPKIKRAVRKAAAKKAAAPRKVSAAKVAEALTKIDTSTLPNATPAEVASMKSAAELATAAGDKVKPVPAETVGETQAVPRCVDCGRQALHQRATKTGMEPVCAEHLA